jgi:membrane associated rhomboid family serine protease
MQTTFLEDTKGIRAILIVTVAVWVCQILPGMGGFVSSLCDLVPYKTFTQFQLWRLFTYLFLHDPRGPFHILFNMLTLWMFGAELERLWGTRRFVTFYCVAGVCSGLFSLFTAASPVMWFMPVIGASGAVLALLTVYALYFPSRQILLFFLFPVNVLVAVAIFGFISLMGSVQSAGTVSHLTHLGGIVVGFLYVKGLPWVRDRLSAARARAEESGRRSQARRLNREERYFETVVDPILKKISASGMESLTEEEKLALQDASKRKRKTDKGPGNTLPFRRP